jgi:hypothetical protein
MTIPLWCWRCFPSGRVSETALAWFPAFGFAATIEAHTSGVTEVGSEAIAALVFLIGLYFAYLFHLQRRSPRTPWL